MDELPQLFNVLRGEMSLVGPRPLILDEDQRIEGWHRRRLALHPGITGHWQILGPATVSLREMVAMDYLYVANWSLWTDVKILLRTSRTSFAVAVSEASISPIAASKSPRVLFEQAWRTLGARGIRSRTLRKSTRALPGSQTR